MAFSYDNWKKKQKKNTEPGIQSFESFKSEKGSKELEPLNTHVKTYEQYDTERRGQEYDAQPPKSEKARQADADRFARGHESPKSDKARQADADRFSGGAQASYQKDRTSNTQTKSASSDPKKKAGILSEMLDTFKTVSKDLGFKNLKDAYNPKNSDELQAFLDKDHVNDTLVEKRSAALRLGVGDTVKGLGQGISYMDKKVNPLSGVVGGSLISKAGDYLAKQGDKMNEGFEKNTYGKEFSKDALTDPEWYATSVTRTLPNAVSSILPGLGSAKLLGNVNKISKLPALYKTIIQAVGGSAATTAYDSALLSGGIYEEAKSRGMSEEDAMKAADKAFLQNSVLDGGLNTVEFGLGLMPFAKGISKVAKAAQIGARATGGALSEGFQEGMQSGIEAKALGDKFSWKDPSTIEAALIGGIIGGTMTGGLSLHEAMKDGEGKIVKAPSNGQSANTVEVNPVQDIIEKTISELPSKRREQFDDAVFSLREQGIELDEARSHVLEEMVSKFPDVQELLSNKGVEYKEDKKLKRELEDNNPITKAENEIKQVVKQQEQEVGQPKEMQATQSEIQPNQTMQPMEHNTMATAVNNAQSDIPLKSDLNAVSDVQLNEVTNTPKTETSTKNETKQTKNEPLEVFAGDKVNLQGTKATTLYEVEQTTPTEAIVKTPNGKRITVPKSRIKAIVEVASTQAFGDGVESNVVSNKIPKTESVGNVELPPNFRNDVHSMLSEFVNDEKMSVNEAVDMIKSDEYYSGNEQWGKIIEEEAAKGFGYKSKSETKEPVKQAKNEVSVPKNEVATKESKKNVIKGELKPGQHVKSNGKTYEVVRDLGDGKVTVKGSHIAGEATLKKDEIQEVLSEDNADVQKSKDIKQKAKVEIDIAKGNKKEAYNNVQEEIDATENTLEEKYGWDAVSEVDFFGTKDVNVYGDSFENPLTDAEYNEMVELYGVRNAIETMEDTEAFDTILNQVRDFSVADRSMVGRALEELQKDMKVDARNNVEPDEKTTPNIVKFLYDKLSHAIADTKHALPDEVVGDVFNAIDVALNFQESHLGKSPIDLLLQVDGIMKDAFGVDTAEFVEPFARLRDLEAKQNSKVVATQTAKEETKSLESPKNQIKFDMNLFEKGNDDSFGINGINSDSGKITVTVIGNTTEEGVRALEGMDFEFSTSKVVSGTKNFIFSKPGAMKEFMETNKKLSEFKPNNTKSPEKEVAAKETTEPTWEVGDTAYLGSSSNEVVIQEINGDMVKAKNGRGGIVSVKKSFLKEVKEERKVAIALQGKQAKKEYIAKKEAESKAKREVANTKEAEDAIEFLEDSVNQIDSMTFVSEDDTAMYFKGEYGFDNVTKEEVKIQKSDGLVFTRTIGEKEWINSFVEYPPFKKEKAAKNEKLSAKDEILSYRKKVREGNYTAQEVKDHFQFIKNNEEEVKAHFMDLLNNSDNHKRKRKDTKENLVNDLYREAMERPAYADDNMLTTRSYDIFASPEVQAASRIKQLEDKINSITDESIKKHLDKRQAERDEKQRMVDSPETIRDFIYKRENGGLSVEEQARLDELQALNQREKQAEKKAPSKEVISKGDYTITPDKDTRDNSDIWVVKHKDKLEKAAYAELARSMKAIGGYYSRFKKGFIFTEDPTAKLNGEIKEDLVSESGRDATRIAERLRTTADNMQKTINDKRNDNRLTNTHKRATQDAYAREEADRLERQQKIMNRIADAIESGEATFLDNVTARTHIETLDRVINGIRRDRLEGKNLNPNEREKLAKQPISEEEINNLGMPKVYLYADNVQRVVKEMTGTKGLGRSLAKLSKEINAVKGKENAFINAELVREDMLKVADAAIKADKEKYVAESIKDRYNDLKRLETMNLDTVPLLRSGIREYIKYVDDVGENTDQKRKDAKRKKEAELSKLNIEGFFPTPTKIIDRMLEEADIQPGMTVLEPSAGKGNIASAIRDIEGVELDVVEYNNTLREYLESEEFNVVGQDFLAVDGLSYDRILMNPPFEKGQDIDHVRHAFEQLNPGGRVVAIMSEGPFYRSDKKATEFREWLEENGGVSEKLEDGSFKDSERTTGVATRLVTIDKTSERITEQPKINDPELVSLYEEKNKLEERITKLMPKDAYLDEVKKYFHLGTVGGSGKNNVQLNKKRDQSIERAIESSKKTAPLFDELRNIERKIHAIESGEKAQKDAVKNKIQSNIENMVVGGKVLHGGFSQSGEVLKVNAKSFRVRVDQTGNEETWTKDMITAATLPKNDTPANQTRATGETFTENGTKIEFEYRIVDASDLIASNDASGNVNPNYPKELQPRDRSRKASQVQIQNIAQKLNPALLGESVKASDGAPIVGEDMVVESGNGRTIALKKMYEDGYDTKETYDEFITNFAEKHDIDFNVYLDNPVLVRVRKNEVDRKKFVIDANESSISAMSSTEQAMIDAERLTPGLMKVFRPGENGELNTASNQGFLVTFMGEIVSKSDRGKYTTANDSYSQEFLNRVRNSVFAKAYGNSEAVSILSENTDNNVRIVVNAMLKSAPNFALMRDGIENGYFHNEDISPDIVKAMVKLADLRAEGTNVQTFLNQISMFDEMSPEAKEMLKIFDHKVFKRSTKKLSELFNGYARAVEAADRPDIGSIFGESPPTKADFLATAMRGVKADEVQADLFEAESENSNETRATSKAKGNKNTETFVGLKKRDSNTESFNPKNEAEGNDRSVTRGEIVEYIQKNFKTSVNVGKVRKHKGVYKTKFSIIRTKDYGDFEVLAHELGHHIDLKLGLSSDPAIREELIKFAEANLVLPESMPKSTRAKEGVAEYFRQYFYNENKANIGIGELSEDLHDLIAEGLDKKKWTGIAEELRNKTTSWLNRDAIQELRGTFSPIGEKRKTRRTLKRFMNETYTKLFEEGHPIFMAMESARKETGKAIEGKDDAYAMFRLTRGSTARAATFASGYTFDGEGNVTGESLEAILKDVEDIEAFGHYLGAKRGMYLKENRGKKKLPFSDDLINEYLAKETPQYKEAAKRVYAYQDRLLQVLVDGGLIPEDLPATLKENDPYYVPFYRVMNDTGIRDGKGGNGRSNSIANQQQGIKRMSAESSSRTIINPIENIIKNTHLFFALADRNSVGKALSNLADPDSEYASEISRDIIEAVPGGFNVTEVALEQLKKTLLDSGLDEDVMEELDMSKTAKIFNPIFKPNSSQNEILVWKDGKPKLFKVHDEMLYNSLIAGDNRMINNLTENVLFKGAKASNSALRWGITASPYFTLRIFYRSLFQLAVKTEAKGITQGSFNHTKQIWEVIKGVKHVLAKDSVMYDWWASGGAQSTFISVENEYIDKKLNNLAMNRKALNMLKFKYRPENAKERKEIYSYIAKNTALAPFKLLQQFNDVLDQSLKIAEYNVVKKQTGDRTKAAIASRDADADYRRMGSGGIKQYNQINLFFNISLQGPDNIARTFAKHKVRTMLRGSTLLMLPTLILYMINRDDKEYEELNSWEKDLNWCIPKGDGTFYKIMIPFEIGLLFKTIPEKLWGNMLDFMKGEDKQSFDGLWDNASKTLLPSFLPTAADIYAKYKSGKDMMNNREFVPMSLKGLEPQDQYTETTSEIMKWFGAKTKRSPILLEETFKSQFAQMGQGALWGADALLGAAGLVDKPDLKGVVPSYTERYVTASVNDGGTASITDFYEKKKELEAARNSDTNKVKYYIPPELASYNQAADDLRDLNKVKNELLYDKIRHADGSKFTKEEKKLQADAINHARRDIARYVQGKEPLNQQALIEGLAILDNYHTYQKQLDKESRKQAKELKSQDKR